MKNSNPGVIHPEVKQFVVNVIYFIRNIINSSAMLFGAVVLMVVDVALGGIVLGQIFIDYEFSLFGKVHSGEFIGWGLSLVFWYVQLLLWDYVFKDGKLDQKDIPAILLAIIIAIIDTFFDSSSVILATTNSVLSDFLSGQEFFGMPLFDILVDLLFVSVMIVTGLNEFFNKLITNDADLDFFGSNHRKQQAQKTKPRSNFGTPVNKPKSSKYATSRKPTNKRKKP